MIDKELQTLQQKRYMIRLNLNLRILTFLKLYCTERDLYVGPAHRKIWNNMLV